MKKALKIIIPIIIILVAACAGCFFFSKEKFQYNNKNAVGNTTGNLNNGGKFCEYDGKIYFSNPCDSGKLYVMDSNCTEPALLSNDTVSSINVCGNYIYYVKNNLNKKAVEEGSRDQMFGIIRTDLDGKNEVTLLRDKAAIASLYGNYVYYQKYGGSYPSNLCRVKIDNTDDSEVPDKPYNPACISNGKIYYSDPYNRNQIYSLDTANNKTSLVYPANSYLLDVDNDYIYYIDMSKGYSLLRYNMSSQTLEQIFASSDSKVINFNRYGNKIFIITEGGTNPGLYRINTDGSRLEYIAAGEILSVNCTSLYTFFQYYTDEYTLYRVPTSGNIVSIEEITIK